MEKYATWLKEINKIAFQNSVDYILRSLLLYSTMYQIILTQIPLHRSDILGYSRKYHTPPPPPPYGRHLIGYLKFSGFPGRTTAVFAGFQSLLIQNIKEFQNFAKIWMVFLEFRLKFTKFWGNLWISSHTHWAFLTGFPMSSIGGVWIFSGIAH